MRALDTYTLKGLRNLEMTSRLCMSFAQAHPDEIGDFVPSGMEIFFGFKGYNPWAQNGVRCVTSSIETEDATLQFTIEIQCMDDNERQRHWMASAMGWLFAYRCEDLTAIYTDGGQVRGPMNEWMPYYSGSPMENPSDWEELIRMGIGSAFVIQHDFATRCRAIVDFESQGGSSVVTKDVVDLMVRLRASPENTTGAPAKAAKPSPPPSSSSPP